MLAWDDFKLVKAVADARSLAGAAERLTVNTSTVFRRLGTLEARLGARLFERKRGGYSLTPAGEEMVGLASRMADDVVAFERRIAGQDLKPSGDLRVTTNDALLINPLTPILARFRLAYPDIRLDVVSSNEALNLSRRDADVAIRATAHPPETLIGRRIADIVWGVYGREDEPEAEALEELAERDWVLPSESLTSIRIVRRVRDLAPRERQVYALSTVSGLADAIQAGIGIGPLPCYFGAAMGLKLLLPIERDSEASLWLLTHPDIRGSARVRAFLDFVGGELNRLKPAFECRD
ncbi:LysR family transcriptional regulator [Terrihabitans sp. B22-R8]|uniref:LysR family transcriptional regulator n=1 Tax=Terrihabitans sp. B22-R8 TaxID=3425128 RepID=UPI00403C4751